MIAWAVYIFCVSWERKEIYQKWWTIYEYNDIAEDDLVTWAYSY